MYAVLFVVALVVGAVFVLLGRRRGLAWLEAFRPAALLFGISGFAAGQAFWAGIPGLVVSLSCVAPTILISVNHSRRLLVGRTEARLPAGDVGSGDPAELALAEADRADFVEENAGLRRRMLRMTVIPAIPLLAFGAFYGDWFFALLGGITAAGFGLAASFITRPLVDANRLVSGPEDAAAPLPPPGGDGAVEHET